MARVGGRGAAYQYLPRSSVVLCDGIAFLDLLEEEKLAARPSTWAIAS